MKLSKNFEAIFAFINPGKGFTLHEWMGKYVDKSDMLLSIFKRQLISKGLFGALKTPKKTNEKKFEFTTIILQVDLILFAFWEKLKAPKTFRS